MKQKKTFETLCVELDATLLYARIRMAYKDGLSRNTIAKRFGIKPKAVEEIVAGIVCTKRAPRLPSRNIKWILGVKTYRFSCSETRVKRNSRYHYQSYISRAEHRHGWSKNHRE